MRIGTEVQRRGSSGFSLIELLIVVAIILIIAAIAIPNFLRSRMAANESTAVSNLRTIASAALTYSSTYGNAFPNSVAQMDGPPGPATCDAAQLIDTVLAGATIPGAAKNGYYYLYPAGGGVAPVALGNPPPGCTAGVLSYGAEANPAQTGQTGQRCFFVDETSVIRFDPAGDGACADGTANPPIQ